jgi:uncharacterized protein YggE
MLGLIFAVSTTAGVASATKPPRLITVTGSADVKVVPDQVVVTLGVDTDNGDVGKAKADNDARVQKILALGQKYGIPAAHVQTDNLQIGVNYDDDSHPDGYKVSQTLCFILSDATQVTPLLGDAIAAGANRVDGVAYQTTQLRKYRDQARQMAIQAAKEKATAMAGDLGQTIGTPLSINEGGEGDYYPQYGMQNQNIMQEEGGSSSSSDDGTVALGEIDVSANVTVAFELQGS